jgi:hypothetical protein
VVSEGRLSRAFDQGFVRNLLDAPPYQLMVFPHARAIIKGTVEVGMARSLYSEYIGG